MLMLVDGIKGGWLGLIRDIRRDRWQPKPGTTPQQCLSHFQKLSTHRHRHRHIETQAYRYTTQAHRHTDTQTHRHIFQLFVFRYYLYGNRHTATLFYGKHSPRGKILFIHLIFEFKRREKFLWLFSLGKIHRKRVKTQQIYQKCQIHRKSVKNWRTPLE